MELIEELSWFLELLTKEKKKTANNIIGFSFKVRLSPSKKAGFIFSNGRPLNMIENAFYFMLKALFVLKIFTFCPDFFGHAEKRPDKNAKVNFKLNDVTYWETNNYNTHVADYLKK